MTAFNFPNAPTVGQTYTPAGGPTYSWNGVAWTVVGINSAGGFYQQTFTATANQTLFTPSNPYLPGLLDVFHNGVKLVNGIDYVATNGTQIYLAYGAAAGDTIQTIAYAAVSGSNVYTKTEIDNAPDGRNVLINPGFTISQRYGGTPTFAAPITKYFGSDRWAFTANGTGGAGNITLNDFTPGQTDVPGNPERWIKWQITSAASGQTANACVMEQRIEGVRTLSNGKAALSVWLKGVGTLPSIILAQSFGSGGSAGVSTTLATNVVLTSTWTKHIYIADVPSIAGKTVGANNYLSLAFAVPVNATFTLEVAQVKLEAGAVATPFEARTFTEELALCERYYEKSHDYAVWPANPGQYPHNAGLACGPTQSGAINVSVVSVRFKTRKRPGTLTLQTYNPTTGTAGQARSSAGENIATTWGSYGETGGYIYNSGGAIAANSVLMVHYTAEAEL